MEVRRPEAPPAGSGLAVKKALDRAFGAFIAVIAIMAGFAVAADLLRPYMAWVVGAGVVMVVVITTAVAWPAVQVALNRARKPDEPDWFE